ncbi:hypothetical protein [Pengzhenrongella sicca]|uniref:Uncharacterized protein n=1 Tax=Pengzhenrongella sicca TaxID=2819238 RepID=A0A8A4ZAC7_9MICO|nr:hypothetical protein [Pengzhenrongella sicca]QTE27843.1 hypothetical protein J4E96_10435 [Pengzhenrongella sicca]
MTTFDDSWDDELEDDFEDEFEDDREGEFEDNLEGFGVAPGPPGSLLASDEEVHELLLRLVGPERGGPPAVWVLLLDRDRRATPFVLPIGDVPTIADRALVVQLARTLRIVLGRNAPGGSVAVALVRRGGGDRGTFEIGWSTALVEALTQVGVPVRAVVAIGRDRSRVLPTPRR